MATLILSTVGTMLGGPIGGLLGTLVGQGIDQQLLGGGARKGPRLGDLSVQTSSYGSMIPRIYGTMRVAGTVVWATDLKEDSELQGDGKSQPETVVYTYSASFAVALSSRQAGRIKRIWADGKLLRGAAGDFKVATKFRFLPGSDDQAIDPLIASVEGAANTPAYRGIALAVFEDLQLSEFGNRIPSITFELEADEDGSKLGDLLAEASRGAIVCADERIVPGYAVHGQDIGSALEPLIEAFAIDLRDEGDALRLPPLAPPRLPLERELGASWELSGSIAVERSQTPAASVPAALTLTYYDPSRDYQTSQARNSVPAPSRVNRQFPLPCVLDAGSAKAMVETLLARAWAIRDRLTIRLPPNFLDLAPGSAVRIAGIHGDWIVERIAIERFVVEASLRPAWRSAGDRIADPGRGLPQPDIVAAPTELALFDLPDPGAVQPILLLAAANSSPGWKSVPIQIEAGGTVSADRSASRETVLGTALTALPGGQPFVMDIENYVDVQLADPDHWLESSDDAGLAMGANLAVLGNELVQFGAVEPLGAGKFRLSRLLRGRRGTEWAMDGHMAGEPFALIDARTLKPISIAIGLLGVEVTVTAQGPGDVASSPSVTRVARGESLRPLSPAHPKANSGSDGSIQVSWVPRSREGFAWLDEVDVPPDPTFQGYRITVSGPSAELERDVADTVAVISATELGSLGAGPLRIEIRQIGSLALSRPASIIFDNA